MHRNHIWVAMLLPAIATGCDQPIALQPTLQTAAPPPAVAAAAKPPSLPFEWHTIGGSKVELGPPARLHLADGYAYAYLPASEVFPGDVATAMLEVTGPADRPVTAILQRHCNGENGGDATIYTFELTGQRQLETIQHKFEAQYGCFRLSILSADKIPLDLTVDALNITLAIGSGETKIMSMDPTFDDISSDRDRFGRVIFYFGDSISRGATLRKFPDQFTAAEANREANWNFRSPASTSNTTLDKKAVAAVFAGQTGQPRGTGVERFKSFVKRGIIRPGDVVVLEDAGQHLNNPAQYRANWVAIREALADAGVTIVMTTMPDFANTTQSGSSMSYDSEFNGQSHNDATRAAALVDIGGSSRTVLIDLDRLLSHQSYFRDDGIHFNFAGQCVFVREVSRAASVSAPDCDDNPAK